MNTERTPRGNGEVFQELLLDEFHRRRRRFIVPLTVASLILIGGFLIFASFFRTEMARPGLGQFPIGWLWAIAIVPIVMAVVYIYIRMTDKLFDQLLIARHDAEGGKEWTPAR
jgi:uncharacterized membrane protein (DUF485 family)